MPLRRNENACKRRGARRPLTAKARVRIPYGPRKYLQINGFSVFLDHLGFELPANSGPEPFAGVKASPWQCGLRIMVTTSVTSRFAWRRTVRAARCGRCERGKRVLKLRATRPTGLHLQAGFGTPTSSARRIPLQTGSLRIDPHCDASGSAARSPATERRACTVQGRHGVRVTRSSTSSIDSWFGSPWCAGDDEASG